MVRKSLVFILLLSVLTLSACGTENSAGKVEENTSVVFTGTIDRTSMVDRGDLPNQSELSWTTVQVVTGFAQVAIQSGKGEKLINQVAKDGYEVTTTVSGSGFTEITVYKLQKK